MTRFQMTIYVYSISFSQIRVGINIISSNFSSLRGSNFINIRSRGVVKSLKLIMRHRGHLINTKLYRFRMVSIFKIFLFPLPVLKFDIFRIHSQFLSKRIFSNIVKTRSYISKQFLSSNLPNIPYSINIIMVK